MTDLGLKKTSDGNLKSVFPNYYVWDDTKNTTSNSDGWEYVGTNGATGLGTGSIKLDKGDQTIKYWDYSASEYHFVAGSPIKAFTFTVPSDGESKKIESATITGLAGHIDANAAGTALVADPVYIAAPVKVKKANYQKPVEFTFQRQQSMVRVGFYETIPGYSITKINFYDADGVVSTTNHNIILTSSKPEYFVGGTNVSGTVKYNWTETPSYTFEYKEDRNLTKNKNWYAGKLNVLAETSTADVAELYGTDQDMAATGYFTVLPTPETTTASAILIKCDYELTADDLSGETINVTGATAAIPAAFSKWEANTRYTYLFKISDNTNGTTGTPGTTDPAGLFPITFNAVVKEVEQGTTTTVATPSITTYQEGSVVEKTLEGSVVVKTIEYKTGKPIYATVADETTGTLNELKKDGTIGNVQVYKLSKKRTEAELQVAAVVADEIKTEHEITTYVPTANTTVNKVTLDANKHLYFEPTAEGYYAIQYKTAATPDAYTYKVVYVKAVTPAP